MFDLGDEKDIDMKHTHNNAGLISRTDFGRNVARKYEYDIHGWPIINQWSMEIGNGKSCNYFKINGDENSTELFEFLVDNSEVETLN